MDDDAVCSLSEAGKKISKLTIVALFGTIALNPYGIGISLELFLDMFFIPQGSSVRPMDFAVKVFCAFLVGGVFLLPLSYAAFFTDASMPSRWLIVLSLLPLLLGFGLLGLAALRTGLTISDGANPPGGR